MAALESVLGLAPPITSTPSTLKEPSSKNAFSSAKAEMSKSSCPMLLFREVMSMCAAAAADDDDDDDDEGGNLLVMSSDRTRLTLEEGLEVTRAAIDTELMIFVCNGR